MGNGSWAAVCLIIFWSALFGGAALRGYGDKSRAVKANAAYYDCNPTTGDCVFTWGQPEQ